MSDRGYNALVIGSVCLLLMGCASAAHKSSAVNLYELSPVVGGRPAVVDNDSYYVQPSVYKGCASINDAPSCGGS